MQAREVDIPRVLFLAQECNFRVERTVWNQPPRRTIHSLFEVLDKSNANYLIVGDIAFLTYIKGRNTEDLSIILALEDALEIPDLVIQEQDQDFARAQFRDVQVDLLRPHNPFFQMILDTYATEMTDQERSIRVVSPRGLLLLKLFALPSLYRQANLDRVRLYEGDIGMLLDAFPDEVDILIENLGPYLPSSDIKELRKLLLEIVARGRSSTRFDNP